MTNHRSRLVIIVLIAVIFSLLWLLYAISTNIECRMYPIVNRTKELPNSSLYALGIRFQTDKIFWHRFDVMYERYLKEYRGQNFTLLEIGLGCHMPLGEGASASMWKAYFGTQVNIHIIEINKICGEKWLATKGSQLNVTMHYGSQTDVAFLRNVIDKVKHFDIIIDDGGHSMDMQITTLRTLLAAVRNNGLYIIEDLLFGYLPDFGGGPIGSTNTTIAILKQLVDDVQIVTRLKSNPGLSKYIYSFEVGPDIVFFRVKNQ